jgi:hypothetical protein
LIARTYSYERVDLLVAGFAALIAATVAAIALAASPYDHGGWLVAYLFLVGFLAQILLGIGQVELLGLKGLPPPTRGTRSLQALLWNLGVVAVPLGVLAGTKLLVIIGSLALIAALISFRNSAGAAVAGPRWLARGYAGLLLGLLASVFIGTALAWDIPWT